MTTLKITAKGQITLRKELLAELGLAPGDKVDVEVLPERKLVLSPKAKGNIEDFFGLFYKPGRKPISIEEMNEIIADGWAGKR